MTSTISVVIVSWNTRELLASCLEQLDGDVTVVDNASSDGSVEMVRERFGWVRLIANAHNAGFARACNQAIRASQSTYVLLLNPDTQVAPSAVEILAHSLDEHARTGAVGARILNSDGTLQTSCFRAPRPARELWRLLHLDAIWPFASYPMSRWETDRPRFVDVLHGACMMIRRGALEEVGLLDEDYFMYSEEVDLCRRLRHAGWELAWVPTAVVTHHGGASTRQVAAMMFLRLYAAKIMYFRKHYGRSAVWQYKAILAAASAIRLAAAPVACFEPPKARTRHLSLAGHYSRLLRALPDL